MEHFKLLLPNNSWKKAVISEQEKQSLEQLFSNCFVPIPERPLSSLKGADQSEKASHEAAKVNYENRVKEINEGIYTAAETLIKEVGKDFLSADFNTICLNKGHFIGANTTERGKKILLIRCKALVLS